MTSIAEYTLHRKLGSGASADVWEASYNGENCALKFVRMDNTPEKNERALRLFINEFETLNSLRHGNVIKAHELNVKSVLRAEGGEEKPVIYLALELAGKGELFDYVALTGTFSDSLARHYFKAFLAALDFIHARGFAHRDIKLENLLLTDDYQLKVADFGLSSPLSQVGSRRCVGTLDYMAPEINSRASFCGVKADLFALGVMLFTVVAGHKPFKKASVQDKWYRMLTLENEKFWSVAEHNKSAGIFSREFKDLINKLLAYKAEARPSIETIKEHPWYKGADMEMEEVREEMSRRHVEVLRKKK
eukprot:TRINITY_DN3469_c0_g1_i14.p1 TRINITY_DN3469_c0_g1~~TRINITY_DN3469_c0_g1_i14.p1  ORF type:complete len:323 (-),score=95.91 TRINITY_DN3469_c0_g1_i14:123-1037(-)